MNSSFYQIHTLHPVTMSPSSPLVCDSFSSLLLFCVFSNDLDSFEEYRPGICRTSLDLGLSDVFSCLNWGYRCEGRITHGWSALLVTSCQGIPGIYMTSLMKLIFITCLRWCHYFFPSYIYFLEESLSPGHTWSRRWGYLHILLEILLKKNCPFSVREKFLRLRMHWFCFKTMN